MSGQQPFRVVTDSTSDVPPDWRARLGISVVPLTVTFGAESFRDGVDLSPAQFYERLARADRLPTTAAPAPGAFAEVYRRLARECEGVVSIHIGSSLSGTAEAARLGALDVPELDVRVIDSGSLSMCAGFLCEVAAAAADLDDAVREVEARVPRLRILALLDTLRYVEMGGRVGRAQAALGSVLDLKPILGLRDGEIRSLDRVRTRARALPRLVETCLADRPIERLAVMHAQSPADAERLREELAAELPGVELVIGELGTVLGTHAGPGTVGVAYVKA